MRLWLVSFLSFFFSFYMLCKQEFSNCMVIITSTQLYIFIPIFATITFFKCCFTSTDYKDCYCLRDVHLDFHTAPELWPLPKFKVTYMVILKVTYQWWSVVSLCVMNVDNDCVLWLWHVYEGDNRPLASLNKDRCFSWVSFTCLWGR